MNTQIFQAKFKTVTAKSGLWKTGSPYFYPRNKHRSFDPVNVTNQLEPLKNPLGAQAHPAAIPLMVDDYVRVSITGRVLPWAIALPRSVLQDANTLWINRDNTLDIRKVSLAWKDSDHVYIDSGLTPGEAVITSGLAVPVQGMPLRTQGEGPHKGQRPEPKAPGAGESK